VARLVDEGADHRPGHGRVVAERQELVGGEADRLRGILLGERHPAFVADRGGLELARHPLGGRDLGALGPFRRQGALLGEDVAEDPLAAASRKSNFCERSANAIWSSRLRSDSLSL
jgi:hypothetical protein